MIFKSILKNYLDKVSPRVDMKNERELALKYLDSEKSKLKEAN